MWEVKGRYSTSPNSSTKEKTERDSTSSPTFSRIKIIENNSFSNAYESVEAITKAD